MDSQYLSSWFHFDYTFTVSLTFHFIHNQFYRLQISLHSFTSYRNPPMGPSQSNPSCTGAPIFVSAHLSQSILYSFGNCKKSLFPAFTYLFVVTLDDLIFSGEETHVALGWGIHYLLLFLTSSVNPEYPTVHVPTISEFVHFFTPLAQFNPRLVIPLTLVSVSRLLPLILHIYPQPRAFLSLTMS
jgi:hypothetical protein